MPYEYLSYIDIYLVEFLNIEFMIYATNTKYYYIYKT